MLKILVNMMNKFSIIMKIKLKSLRINKIIQWLVYNFIKAETMRNIEKVSSYND